MALSYLPAGRPGFVPRPCGFGARLLGMDPAAVRTDAAGAIVAVRQERDLLRADLTLLGADGTLLPEALGCGLAQTGMGSWRVTTAAGTDPDDWHLLELGDPDSLPALAAVLAVAGALERECSVGVLLSGPLTLAEHVAGRPVDAEALGDEELIDACALVVCDATKAVLAAGGHVVLEERRAASDRELALCAPLLNVLAHHRRPALALVHDDHPGAFDGESEAVGATAWGQALPDWGGSWHGAAGVQVFSPRIAACASPERVQELLRDLRATVPA